VTIIAGVDNNREWMTGSPHALKTTTDSDISSGEPV